MLCFVYGAQCCVCTCFQSCTVWRHTKKGAWPRCWGGVWVAVAAYQYSERTLSETTTSPVGPSARQSLFMDAEHASCHLVSSAPSLLSSCSSPPFCNLFASVQTQIPVSFFFPWTHMSAMGALKGENVLTGMKEACGYPRSMENQKNRVLLSFLVVILHWSLAVLQWLHLAKEHRRRLKRKWKHGTPVLPNIIPSYLHAVIYFKTAWGESFPYWRCWNISTTQMGVLALI